MRLLSRIGLSAATAVMAVAIPLGATPAHATTRFRPPILGTEINGGHNYAILGFASNGGVNWGILGVACGSGAVNTGILGRATTGPC